MICRGMSVMLILICALVSGFIAAAAWNASGQEPVGQRKSDAEVWSQSCGRCHNIISPAEYYYRQWILIVRSMRSRANLLAREEKQILEFFRSASSNSD